MVISPEFGSFAGYYDIFTTLPMEETKPVDAGIWRFCHTCNRCADTCPSGSISTKSESTWDPDPSNITPKYDPLPGVTYATAEFHNRGTKRLWTDMAGCQIYQRSVQSCNLCYGVCTFNSSYKAMIHDAVRATVATTGVFNGFLWKMGDLFGYGLKEGEAKEDWWDMSLPAYGFSTTMTNRDGYR
jgi:epoxyqueuosine reductase